MDSIPHARFILFAVVTAIVTAANAVALPLSEAFIGAFDLGALAFIVSVFPLWRDDSPHDLRRRALRDDGGRVLISVIALLAILAVLVALGSVAAARHKLTLAEFSGLAATIVIAWTAANIVYAFHYAHIFYSKVDEQDAGGIDFPGAGDVLFADFVYFAFVLGMTCQTADANITSRPIRRLATLHGLFAFFFNLGVLALTVNILASLL